MHRIELIPLTFVNAAGEQSGLLTIGLSDFSRIFPLSLTTFPFFRAP